LQELHACSQAYQYLVVWVKSPILYYRKIYDPDSNADVFSLLLTVNPLPEELQCTVREMLKDLESDKATGRYVVWLRFTRVLQLKDCKKEGLLQFFQLQGQFF